MADIEIRPVSPENMPELYQVDSAFTVQAEYAISLDDTGFRLAERAVAPYTKRYTLDPGGWPLDDDHGGWLVYADGRPAGRMLVRRYWNGLAWIENIAVSPPWRGLGIGRRLLQEAVLWTREHGLPGLVLETQNANVPACRFYQSCGMILGGIDRMLYRAIPAHAHEIAMFYYLFLEGTRS